MKQAICIAAFFVFVGVISGAMSLTATLVTILALSLVLLFKWLEKDKSARNKKDPAC